MAKRVDPRLSRAVRSVNEEVLNRAIRHAVYMERLKSHEAQEVVDFLGRDVVPVLLHRVEKKLLSAPASWGTAIATEVLVESSSILRAGMEKAGVLAEANIVKVALSESEWQRRIIADALPISMSLGAPSVELVYTAATSSPIEGALLKDWFSSIGRKAAEKIAMDVRVGISAGDPVDVIMKTLKGNSATFESAFASSSGSTAEMNRAARSVVRTAINEATTKTKELVYSENADVLKGIIIVATLDNRTTDTCKALDGKIFPVDSGPRPPFHWGCRTTTAPVTKSWKELGINLKDTTTSTRASMNGEVPSAMTYGEWLKGQPRAFQDEVLGKGRAQLFRSGQVPIERFVDGSGARLSLRQVRLREGLAGDIPSPGGP